MADARFVAAYQRGVAAAGQDYSGTGGLTSACGRRRRRLDRPGDFVECGVNRGVMSSSIMAYLDWDRLAVLPAGHVSRPGRAARVSRRAGRGHSEEEQRSHRVGLLRRWCRQRQAQFRRVAECVHHRGDHPRDSRAGEGELDRVPAPRLELRATGSGGPEELLSRGWRNDAVDLLVCFETIEQVDQQQEPAQPLRPPDSGGPA